MKAPGFLPEFGGFADNVAAYHLAVHALRSDQSAYGIAILRGLYAHMLATREIQSLHWLLPDVEAALLAHRQEATAGLREG